jgi:zinc protease
MRDFHLRSGLRIIVEEDHSAPVVGVVMVVGAGSTSDPQGKEGLAHLVEHLTFRAKPAPGRDVWGLLEQAGAGDLNARTSFDSTVFYEFGPRDILHDILLLEGLRIADPLAQVDEKAFEVEREVVRNELRERGETHVAGAVWAAVLSATFPKDHAYSRPPIGSHESLSSLTLSDARAFVKQHYRPSNITLLVVGDVKLETFERVFSETLPPSFNEAGADPVVRGPRLSPHGDEPPSPPAARGFTTIEGQVATPELYISWSLPRGYDEASYLNQLAVGSVRAAISGADDVDSDIVGGSAFMVPGKLASTLLGRVVLREGTHPDTTAEHVLDQLYGSWTGNGGQSALLLETLFEKRRSGLATAAMVDGENIEERGLERAEFVHFSGDPALYTRKFRALGALDRGKLADFHMRYVNRDRARVVLVRPLPHSAGSSGARIGLGEAPEASADRVSFDVDSLRKLAVPVGFSRAFERETLDNGLLIEATRRGTIPLVTVGLGFRGGRADERVQGAAEVAWLAADVQRVHDGHLFDHGALMARRLLPDGVEFVVHAPAAELGPVLRILADHVVSWRVHATSMSDFDRFRLPYLRRAQAMPDDAGDRVFREALFKTSLYAHTGEVPDSSRPGENAANDWLESVLTPSRATLAIAGDVDPTEARGLARDAFASWSGPKAPPDPSPLAESGGHASFVTHRPGSTQAVVEVGCRLSPGGPAAATENEVLARAFSGHLRSLRDEMGLTYGFRASSATLRGGTAVLVIQGTVENAGLGAALKTIHGELAGADRLTQSDFDRGRWSIARQYNLGLATPDDWVETALSLGRRGWDLQSVDDAPRRLGKIDRARLVGSLRRCASEGVISIVGDEQSARRALGASWP